MGREMLLYFATLCIFYTALCVEISDHSLTGLEWQNSRHFQETISFESMTTRRMKDNRFKMKYMALRRKNPTLELGTSLYVNNPTDLKVKLSFYRDETHLFDKAVNEFSDVAINEALVSKITVTVHSTTGNAHIMLLQYPNHQVILVGDKTNLPGHIEWLPAHLTLGPYDGNDESNLFQTVTEAYVNRAKQLLSSPPQPPPQPHHPQPQPHHPQPHPPHQHDNNNNVVQHNAAIPKHIHWVWLGKELPKPSALMMYSVFKHHPDWSFTLWHDHHHEELLGDAFKIILKDRIEKTGGKFALRHIGQLEAPRTTLYKISMNKNLMAMCSDMIRAEVLLKHGGVYLDHDVGAVGSLNKVVTNFGFFAPLMLVVGRLEINNDVLGSRQGHPCILAIFEKIMRNAEDKDVLRDMEAMVSPTTAVVYKTTGPTLVANTVLEHLSNNKDMIVLPDSFLHGIPSDVKRYFTQDWEFGDFTGIFPETITFTTLAGKWLA